VLKISLTGAPEHIDRTVGYGEASRHVIDSFEKSGIECLIKSREPNIGISFNMPHSYLFGKDQYKIGYTPWESTELLFGWHHALAHVDELWTTSSWCADIFSKHTDKPIFVYEHGILDEWIPKKRSIDKSRPFRFLHVGGPADRKDAQAVVDTFIELYGDNPDYELILKCSRLNTTRVKDPVTKAFDGSPNTFYKNIKIIESSFTPEQMVGLYDLCDAFVYPSWGEGFGFNPLQAMAMGIPTICTEGWATYARYITMPLSATWWQSPWPEVHPGLLMKPNADELKFYMQDVVQNYDRYSDVAYKNAFLIHKDYNWDKVSKPAVERLKKIQKDHF
jgi:glycosyltransferase involved in cell wall biosynthesis